MNILIFEYITGGGMVGEELPASLGSEGELMLDAVANDFAELPDVQVSVLRDYRLQATQADNQKIVSLEISYKQVIESMENEIDALLLIAPESNGVLSSLCKTFANRNFKLLNSSSKCTALLGDKLDTFHFLQNYDIPQIPSYDLSNTKAIQSDELILK